MVEMSTKMQNYTKSLQTLKTATRGHMISPSTVFFTQKLSTVTITMTLKHMMDG